MSGEALVLTGARARLRVGVEGAVVDSEERLRLLPIEAVVLDAGQELLVEFGVLGAHGHVLPGEVFVEFGLTLLASAVLHDAVDELIDSRRLREFRDFVSQSFGFLF